MKQFMIAGVLAVAAGMTLLAQQQQAGQKQGAPAGQQAAPAQGAPAQAKGPSPKSPAEGQAVMALSTAANQAQTNPDAAIKAAEDLLTKFADTDYKEFALSVEAQAYKMKGDSANAQVFAERALEANPKSYQMSLLLGEVISAKVGEFDLDKEVRLAKADKCFNDTIAALKDAPKPNPGISDDQWAQYRQFMSAEAHNGLGSVALIRKKWDVAIVEFKAALDGDPQQDAYATRLAHAQLNAGQNDEAIALCDKLLAKPDLNPTIKNFVTQIKTQATAAKAKK
jgi:tetratricopeptide (TPR) repeat protein